MRADISNENIDTNRINEFNDSIEKRVQQKTNHAIPFNISLSASPLKIDLFNEAEKIAELIRAQIQ